MTGMLGNWKEFVSLLPSLAGFCFVLYAVGIVLRSDWMHLRESELLKIVEDFKESVRPRGTTKLAPVAITVLCCIALVTVPVSIALARYFSRYPTYEIGDSVNLVEVKKYDGLSNRYELRYKGIDFWMRLCEKPPFDPGDYLTLFKYEDRGVCQSLAGEWTAVLIRRNEHGQTDSEIKQGGK